MGANVNSVPGLRSAEPPDDENGSAEKGLQRGGSRVFEAVDRLSVRTIDIGRIMSDLRVSPPMRDALQPLIQAGFVLEDKTIVSEVDQEGRQITLVTRAPEVYYIVQLPRVVLRSESQDNKNLISALNFILPQGARMYIVSHRVDAIPITFMNILKLNNRVDARFVPSLHVCGFDGKTILPLSSLLTAFGLSREPVDTTATKHLPEDLSANRSSLSQQQRRKPSQREIDQIASDLRDIIFQPENPQASYNDFVSNLSLPGQLLSKAQSLWNGNMDITTTNLVRWANTQGRRTLGLLIEQVIKAAPGRDDVGELVQIADECGLMSSDCITSLRTMIEEMEIT
jgi:hypothetical protein